MTSVYVAEPRVEHISAESVTELSTRTGQMRHLVAELGVTRPQAYALVVAYERDMADAARVGNTTPLSDAAFVAWLMEQVPGGRRPRVRRFAVGDPGWRVTSA